MKDNPKAVLYIKRRPTEMGMFEAWFMVKRHLVRAQPGADPNAIQASATVSAGCGRSLMINGTDLY